MGRDKKKKKKKDKKNKSNAIFSVDQDAEVMPDETAAERKARIFTPKYSDSLIFQIYSLYKSGMKQNSVEKTIGVAHSTFEKWKKKRPLVALAIEEGTKLGCSVNAVQSFHSFVEESLPDDLHDLWAELNAFSDEPDATRRITTLLATKGERVHQQLFLHALVDCNFNVSKAKMKVAVSQAKLMRWTKDREFSKLLQHVNETKKDFFEGALLELVAKGDSTCTVFANKTFNRDRGYNEKVDINISGNIDHNHNLIDISKLDLSLDVKRQILQAARKQRLLTDNSQQIIPTADGIEELAYDG